MPTAALKATYFAALAPQGVDVEAGKITGLCLMKTGPALGHGQGVDGTTLTQLVSECQKAGKMSFVVKHDGHPLDVVGDLSNFRVDGDSARADLDVYSEYPDKARFLEIAKRNPGAFGTSAEFKNSPETIGSAKFARVEKVRRFALERDPAASPNGLFSEAQPKPDALESMTPEELTAAIGSAVSKAFEPLKTKIDSLESKFGEIPKPLSPEDQKKRDDALVLEGFTQFAASVGIKAAPKSGTSGEPEKTDPTYLTKFKAHKTAAKDVGTAIARFAKDDPREYDAWHTAGRPGL